MDNHPSKSTGEANSKRQPRLLVKKEAKDSNGLVVRGVTRLLACVGGDGSGRGWLKAPSNLACVGGGNGGCRGWWLEIQWPCIYLLAQTPVLLAWYYCMHTRSYYS